MKTDSLKLFCTKLAIDKSFKKLSKIWTKDTKIKGRGHVARAWITSVEADAFLRRGFCPKQIASTCDGVGLLPLKL
jgi:hypothetical protein